MLMILGRRAEKTPGKPGLHAMGFADRANGASPRTRGGSPDAASTSRKHIKFRGNGGIAPQGAPR